MDTITIEDFILKQIASIKRKNNSLIEFNTIYYSHFDFSFTDIEICIHITFKNKNPDFIIFYTDIKEIENKFKYKFISIQHNYIKFSKCFNKKNNHII